MLRTWFCWLMQAVHRLIGSRQGVYLEPVLKSIWLFQRVLAPPQGMMSSLYLLVIVRLIQNSGLLFTPCLKPLPTLEVWLGTS